MTLNVAPEVVARDRLAAEENLKANAWVASPPDMEEAFHPDQLRGPDGKWIKKGEAEVPEDPWKLPVPLGHGYPREADRAAVLEYMQAVRESIARHPEMLSGPNPLQRVEWATDPRYVSPRWNVLRGSTAIATLYSGLWSGQRIVINNVQPIKLAEAKHLSPASRTPRGAMTHEMGHVFFRVHGIAESTNIKAQLAKYGIKPEDIGAFSQYGAAEPSEGLAELYAQHFTPGFKIEDPRVRSAFETMINDLRKYSDDHPK